jgi:hypothetical protein
MPRGCVIYISRYALEPLVYLYANGNYGAVWFVIDTGVGFCVARFDWDGLVERPQNVERAIEGLHAFFCVFVKLKLTNKGYQKSDDLIFAKLSFQIHNGEAENAEPQCNRL